MMNSLASYERYRRQTVLKDFGTGGQDKLSKANILVVGAGGLGCPCLQYLAAAGVGRLGILDFDTVALDNLHRQILYQTEDLGKSKAIVAKDRLQKLNPDIRFYVFNTRLTSLNAEEIISPYDIIIDASDNFDTRYATNDCCVRLGKTMVYGAVSSDQGQVAVFNMPLAGGKRSSNYRDLFPDPPAMNEIPNCAEAGVLGVLTGIIGTMMANETIKLITGYGRPLCDEVLIYNSKSNDVYKIRLETPDNGDLKEMERTKKSLIKEPDAESELFQKLEWDSLYELMEQGKSDLIDIRDKNEPASPTALECRRIPMNEIPERLHELQAETIILVCQSGARSASLARHLSIHFGDSKKIYSLRGGLNVWNAKKIMTDEKRT